MRSIGRSNEQSPELHEQIVSPIHVAFLGHPCLTVLGPFRCSGSPRISSRLSFTIFETNGLASCSEFVILEGLYFHMLFVGLHVTQSNSHRKRRLEQRASFTNPENTKGVRRKSRLVKSDLLQLV